MQLDCLRFKLFIPADSWYIQPHVKDAMWIGAFKVLEAEVTNYLLLELIELHDQDPFLFTFFKDRLPLNKIVKLLLA